MSNAQKSTSGAPVTYLSEVRGQYEDYPYPRRNPEEEKSRLLTTFSDSLELINHHCFEGKQNFADNFRVLVAGGGTGDGTIYLAEQLKHTNAQIIQLDISETSLEIARKRAEIRGLKNIRFLHQSLLDAPQSGLGEFDYINCSGVLHHLESPLQGLEALRQMLKDSGAMSLMLYAPYGREGIYIIQRAMKLLTATISDRAEKVALCKELLNSLPAGNIYNLTRQFTEQEIAVEGDAGIYDLFLHSQDVPFSIPQIYELLDAASLQMLELIFIGGVGKSVYNPETYLKDEQLINIARQKPTRERHAMAELLAGYLTTHSFYCAKTPRNKPDPSKDSCIPVYNSLMGGDFGAYVTRTVASAPTSRILLEHRGAVHTHVRLERKAGAEHILSLINGKNTLGQILAHASQNCDQPEAILRQNWLYLYQALNLHDWLLISSSD